MSERQASRLFQQAGDDLVFLVVEDPEGFVAALDLDRAVQENTVEFVRVYGDLVARASEGDRQAQAELYAVGTEFGVEAAVMAVLVEASATRRLAELDRVLPNEESSPGVHRGRRPSATVVSGSTDEGMLTGEASAGTTTKLYRAVSEAEYQQLMRTGRFVAGPNSLGGKFFAENPADAARWGDALEGAGRCRLVEVEVASNAADNLMRWERLDNIGPARYAELDELGNVAVREVEVQ